MPQPHGLSWRVLRAAHGERERVAERPAVRGRARRVRVPRAAAVPAVGHTDAALPAEHALGAASLPGALLHEPARPPGAVERRAFAVPCASGGVLRQSTKQHLTTLLTVQSGEETRRDQIIAGHGGNTDARVRATHVMQSM